MDSRVKSPIEPILASSIVCKGGCFPVRIVLYKQGEEYITHEELLKTETPNDGSACVFKHHGFNQGGYFPYKSEKRPFAAATELDARYNAEADYKERVRKLFFTG